ncbi:DUF3515 domain-containing protein [Nocardioidaceae bacterium]|nr:DUF3515 domain-containing protein [Nocardioidaceae bacterium]
MKAAAGRCSGSALVVVLLAGCGGPVTLPSDGIVPDAAQACRGVVADLPDELSDQPRVEADGAPGAAYDGGITVRCGVREPAALDPFSTCQTVNDIDWYVPESAIEDTGADVVATTIARTPYVELVVPGDLRPPAAAFAQLTDVVADNTRRIGPACR